MTDLVKYIDERKKNSKPRGKYQIINIKNNMEAVDRKLHISNL
jgi:hypothetical protein